MRRAFVFNTGCIRRALDCTKITNYLVENGWGFTNHIPAAELIIISTCGTIRKNEDLSITAIKHITEQRSKSAKVVITGCLPIINPNRVRAYGDFDLVPTRDLDKLDTILNSSIPFRDIPEVNLVAERFLDYVLAYRLFRNSYSLRIYNRLSTNQRFLKLCIWAGDRVNLIRSKAGLTLRQEIIPYFNLRIAEGCAFKCSYCAIRFATGRIKSKPIETIIEEFKTGLKAGHKVFQLICEDTGSYGIDIGTTFPDLLRKVLEIKGDYRLLLIDFGAYWFVKYFEELVPLFKEHPEHVGEVYVSLQSGSNKILRAMRRPEDSTQVISKLKELKEQVPTINLRTTVIIGFPGETDDDFQETVEAIRAVEFSEVQLNKYEDRPGTPASRMLDKIPQEVIDRRYKEIQTYC
jgi:threonylcarbamoyladenosine tRNA methylthiotransferase MtaB